MRVDFRALQKFATWISHVGLPIERVIWRAKVKGKQQAQLGTLLAATLVFAAERGVLA